MAAQSGNVSFVGRSTRTYAKQIYCDDTANHTVLFDAGVGAASGIGDAFFIAPEMMVMTDICLAAATAQTRTQVVRNGVPTGDTLLNAQHLASVTFRPQLRIPFLKGDKVALVQLA